MTELTGQSYHDFERHLNVKAIQSTIPQFRGALLFLTGPSGSGKTSILKHLLKIVPDAEFGITSTSRPQRDFEMDRVHYYFHKDEEFEEMIRQNAFVEHSHHFGHHYGTTYAEIARIWQNHHHLITDVDINGAKSFLTHLEFGVRTFTVFIHPGSEETIRTRILKREPDIDSQSLTRRLERYVKEISDVDWFDVVIPNQIEEDFETPVQMIKAEIESFVAKLPK